MELFVRTDIPGTQPLKVDSWREALWTQHVLSGDTDTDYAFRISRVRVEGAAIVVEMVEG